MAEEQTFLAKCATEQGGVVSTAQLRAAGLRPGAVKHQVARGRLHRVHRGVYAVGHTALGWRGHAHAAVLATNGALSHLSAAAVWDLAPIPTGAIHVVTLGASRSMPGIRVYRRTAETTTHDGLPVTTPTQTLLHLALTASEQRLRALCRQAEIRRLHVDPPPGARGAARLRAALPEADPALTRSELEERFLKLLADAGMPRPRVNARVAGHEVDFHWPDARLVVETDGARTHLTRTAFQHDRTRDADLQAAGHRVVRFTHADVVARPGRLLQVLDSVLAWPASPSSGRTSPTARASTSSETATAR